MDIVDVVRMRGGVCTSGELRSLFSNTELNQTVSDQRLIKAGHGRYALPGIDEDRMTAERFWGALAGPSAARAYGWSVLFPPARPWLSVPRNRKLSSSLRRCAHDIHSECGAPITAPITTVLDCLRRLPVRESVTIADSSGLDPEWITREVHHARGPSTPLMKRACRFITGTAESPLEACLGVLARDFGFRPHTPVDLPHFTVHPDWVHDNGVIAEADGWEYHGRKAADFQRDVERYTLLSVAGWIVLRFTWQLVIGRPDWVQSVLEQSLMLSSRKLERTV